jgi:hypothetical protein
LAGDDGDDHNDGADAEGPGHKMKVLRHGNRTGWQEVMRDETTRRCHRAVIRQCRIDTASVSP